MNIRSRNLILFFICLLAKISLAAPLGDHIGAGTYGQVYKTSHPYFIGNVALKKLSIDENMEEEEIKNEINYINREVQNALKLSSTNHPNIVKFLMSYMQGLNAYVYFEYLPTNLEKTIHTSAHRTPFETKLTWILDLINGIEFIHKNGVVHGDIKPANILITHNNHLKICDFGHSHTIGQNLDLYDHGEIYTLWYRAPELMLSDKKWLIFPNWYDKETHTWEYNKKVGFWDYNEKIDIWAFGLVSYEILTGKALLQGDSEYDQMMKTFQITGTPNEANWPGVSQLAHYSHEFPKWKSELGKINEEIFKEYSKIFKSNQQAKHFRSLLTALSLSLTLDPTKRPSADLLQHQLGVIIEKLVYSS